MIKVALVNMPISSITRPSIGLTQIRSAARQVVGDAVEIKIHYANQHFARAVGRSLYYQLAAASEKFFALPEWTFRSAAFPEQPDNTEEFTELIAKSLGSEGVRLTKLALQIRDMIPGWLAAASDHYKLADADVVGFTSMFSQNTPVLAMARTVKAANSHVLTLMGGANCEQPMGPALAAHVEPIDLVFSGPGTRSFPEVLGRLMRRRAAGSLASPADLAAALADGIPGVTPGKRHTSRVAAEPAGNALAHPERSSPASNVTLQIARRRETPQTGAGRGVEVSIKKLATDLDYDDFLEQLDENAFGDLAPVILIETSRGCWWGQRHHCTFCGLNAIDMNYRAMDAPQALAQLKAAIAYYPKVRQIDSVDNIMPHNFIRDVLPHITVPDDMHIFYEVKANLSHADVAVLARSGVRMIQPGIEALSTPLLKLMDKGTTAAQNVALLRYCRGCKVLPRWNVLLGFPGEAEDYYGKYLNDFPKLFHLPPPEGVFPIRFDRYSPYHDRASDFGLELRYADFYRFIYPFKEKVLNEIAYFFTDTSPDAAYRSNAQRWLGPVQSVVNEWRGRWRDAEPGQLPALRLEGPAGARRIADTRVDRRETLVGQDQLVALLHAQRPRSRRGLLADLREWGVSAAEQILADLIAEGWLFEDDGQLVNLVDVSAVLQPTSEAQ